MAKKEKEVKQKSSYFKGMKAELKKVVWSTPKELLNNTTAVIIFVLIIAVIVFVLDFCFDNLNKYGITKLQEKAQSSLQTEEDTTDSTENSDSDNNDNTENSENDEANIEAQVVENETSESNTESNSETTE